MERLAALAAVLTVCIATTTLIGWVLDIPTLKTIAPGLATMKMNTAIALLLCGMGLLIKVVYGADSKARHIGTILAMLSALMAMLIIIEHLFKMNLGIDFLFGAQVEDPMPLYPGRPSLATAMGLLLIASAVSLLDVATRFSQVLAILSLLLALLGVLGYIYGITALYRIHAYATMAVHTAVAICVLSLGHLSSRPRNCIHHLLTSDSIGGKLARRILPATVLVPLVVGWVRLKGQQAGYYDTEFGLAIFALSVIVILASIVWWNATLLDRTDTHRQQLLADRDSLFNRERLARQRAETAVLARDQLLSLVSHELRTPLTPAVLLLSSLQRRNELPGDVRLDLREIQDQIQIEVRLIDELLDLVRLDQGKLMLERVVVDFHGIIRKTASALDKSYSAKNIEMSLELSATQFHVLGDRGRLQQVLHNLLDNANKFTPDGGGVRVCTSNNQHGQLCVDIIDTGIGIDPQSIDRIFGPFEQGDASTTRRFGGLGIGLTITKRLVELQGGSLQASSPGKDKGAVFTVRLPTCADAAAAQTVASPQDSPAAKCCRLLIVEDNLATLRALERLLRGHGHQITTALCAADAIKAAGEKQFDLLISDIGLPDLSGWELMRQLHEKYHFSGIAISGFVSDADRLRSKESGFIEHLTKPVDVMRLIQTINSVSADIP
jgi:signal transduction histidine kinase